MKDQKWTIDVMWKANSMNREKIEALQASVFERDQKIVSLEASVAERDETIGGLIARIEEHEQTIDDFRRSVRQALGIRSRIEEHEQTIDDGKKIIAELRERSIRSTELMNSLRSENTNLHRQLDALRKVFRELELNVETRGGQVPDLNTAWHMTDKPVDVKQKYLLDDTPLDDSGSGVIDSKPYAE